MLFKPHVVTSHWASPCSGRSFVPALFLGEERSHKELLQTLWFSEALLYDG